MQLRRDPRLWHPVHHNSKPASKAEKRTNFQYVNYARDSLMSWTKLIKGVTEASCSPASRLPASASPPAIALWQRGCTGGMARAGRMPHDVELASAAWAPRAPLAASTAAAASPPCSPPRTRCSSKANTCVPDANSASVVSQRAT